MACQSSSQHMTGGRLQTGGNELISGVDEDDNLPHA